MKPPDRYAVMGHPVHHSRSPFIHAQFAAQCAQHMEYVALDVAPDEFNGAVRDFFRGGGKGLNLTVPHKQAGFLLADSLSERAQRAGAVNTLLPGEGGALRGDNTDGTGLLRDLTVNLGLPLRGQRILLLGAGGAARGVLAPLLAAQPATLVIANRNADRAQRLADTFATQFAAGATLAGGGFELAAQGGWDLIINATAASLGGELPALADSALQARSFCYDMAYGAQDTVFVRWARARGARAVMGQGMLVEQAAEAFWLWRGVRPDTAPVLRAVGEP